MEPMTDEQRTRWQKTGLFPVERWGTGPEDTPLVCPTPTNAELRSLAEAVPDQFQCSGWYLGKPRFGRHFLYADDFRGMGRQWLCDFGSFVGALPDYIAAVQPRTVLRLLDRIAELEARLAETPNAEIRGGEAVPLD